MRFDNPKADDVAGAVRTKGLSRRGFLQAGAAVGGGLLLSFKVPLGLRGVLAAPAETFVPNAFITIDGDGRVTLIMPQVEMGQGTYTSMPMIIAEELEVELSQVQLEAAPPTGSFISIPWLATRRPAARPQCALSSIRSAGQALPRGPCWWMLPPRRGTSIRSHAVPRRALWFTTRRVGP